LPAGRYRFVVAAAMGIGAYAELPAALELVFEPRLYQTTAFRVLVGAFALAMVLLLHRLRTLRLRAQHQAVLGERARIARELHDTLAQSVGAIAFRLEDARLNEDELRGAARQSVEVAWQIARRTVTEARVAIRQLRERAAAPERLPDALRRVIAEADAAVPIALDIAGGPRELGDRVELALLRIGQEAITNAARHARARRIDVSLRYADGAVELCVADDGAGVSSVPGPESGHFGIAGMRERVAEVGGTLDIGSVEGRGTKVSVRVPVRGAA
jgi:signal transduction histidine kinase